VFNGFVFNGGAPLTMVLDASLEHKPGLAAATTAPVTIPLVVVGGKIGTTVLSFVAEALAWAATALVVELVSTFLANTSGFDVVTVVKVVNVGKVTGVAIGWIIACFLSVDGFFNTTMAAFAVVVVVTDFAVVGITDAVKTGITNDDAVTGFKTKIPLFALCVKFATVAAPADDKDASIFLVLVKPTVDCVVIAAPTAVCVAVAPPTAVRVAVAAPTAVAADDADAVSAVSAFVSFALARIVIFASGL